MLPWPIRSIIAYTFCVKIFFSGRDYPLQRFNHQLVIPKSSQSYMQVEHIFGINWTENDYLNIIM